MILTITPVSWFAVVASLVAYMAIGALWYSPLLFVKRWMELAHIDMTKPKNSMALCFGSSIVTCLFITFAFSQLFPLLGVASMANALVVAFLLWLCFHALVNLTTSLFQGLSLELLLITSGHDLVGMLAIAAIMQSLS